MKKFIICIITALISICAYSQNYFSSRSINDEFGKTTTEDIYGRININLIDSTIVVKTEDGKLENYFIIDEYSDGTKESPSSFEGIFYYDEGYYITNLEKDFIKFVKRTIVTEHTHSYQHHLYIFWRYDTNTWEVINTVAYRP